MRRTLPALVVVALSLTAVADAAAASYASRTLKVGSSGSDVRALQRYLDHAGFDTTADGQFGPATRRSVRGFELAESRRVNGAASRGAPTEKAYVGDDGLAVAPASAPEEVKQIIAAGNEIATKPYKYGGGHARWNDSGYDCSGSVSYVLHAAGLLETALDSSGLMRWGSAGRGDWITVRSNPGHAYLVVAGLRFDTSALKANGNRWSRCWPPRLHARSS